MKRELLRRLEKVEAAVVPQPLPLMVVTGRHVEALEPGQRMVDDWLGRDGFIIYAVPRMTSDLSDHGRYCRRVSFVPDEIPQDFVPCVCSDNGEYDCCRHGAEMRAHVTKDAQPT